MAGTNGVVVDGGRSSGVEEETENVRRVFNRDCDSMATLINEIRVFCLIVGDSLLGVGKTWQACSFVD